MYHKNDNFSLECSCSALSNNLSLFKEVNDKIYISCVHKSSVNILIISPDGSSCCHLVPLKNVASIPMILQAKWIQAKNATILVIASERGIQVFDQNGKILIYWYAISSDIEGVEATFARGISGYGDNNFCVGTHKGDILSFQLLEKGNTIDLLETIEAHDSAISDLCGLNNRLVSADDNGTLCLWECDQTLNKIMTFEKFNYPCTSLSIWKEFILASYASGHLRIFNQISGLLVADVTAHARWISAVDIASESGLALSVSEDSFVRIWQLQDNEKPIISHKFSCRIADTELCGACFVDPSGKAFYTTGYDLNEVIKFSM